MSPLLLRVLRLDGAALFLLAVAGAASTLPGAPTEAATAALGGIVVVALLLLTPAVDPIRRLRWDDKPLPGTRLVVALLTIVAVGLLVGPLAGSEPGEMRRLAMLATVVFLGLCGNVFPALKRNRYFGIRTPWTVRDDRVWERTHRVFGHLLVGLALVLVALWPLVGVDAFETVFGSTMLALTAGAVVYSWRLARAPSSRS